MAAPASLVILSLSKDLVEKATAEFPRLRSE
jgi:hypothetical protein